MKAVIQRVTSASVSIDQKLKSEINTGYLILLGITNNDSEEDIGWLVNKIYNLRLFPDREGLMNLSIDDVAGEILLISQFTLHAKIKKGNRPSYIHAAKAEIAIPLYERFIELMSEIMKNQIKTGQFGAKMDVALINDGPVTIIIDTKNKE